MRTHPRPSNLRPHHPGFTLVELLVVVAVIATLIALLLPSLERAREQARRAVCLSNLRQTSIALLAYAHSNRGYFPRHAAAGPAYPEDWLHWQSSRTLAESAISPYLRQGSLTVLRCPSDDFRRPMVAAPNRYDFSYSINPLMVSAIFRPGDSPYSFFGRSGPHFGGVPGASPEQLARTQLGDIRSPSDKLLVLDEDENHLNDGAFDPNTSTLSNRHDRLRGQPATRGTAAFADGHAELIPRSYAKDPRRLNPRLP